MLSKRETNGGAFNDQWLWRGPPPPLQRWFALELAIASVLVATARGDVGGGRTLIRAAPRLRRCMQVAAAGACDVYAGY